MAAGVLRIFFTLALTVGAVIATDCFAFSVAGGAGDAQVAASNCTGCLGTTGCGFCLQTLQCGSVESLQLECASSLALAASECPVAEAPQIRSDLADCTGCLGSAAGCAWCSSFQSCVPSGDTFALGCRATIFDLPCPTVSTEGACARRQLASRFTCVVRPHRCCFSCHPALRGRSQPSWCEPGGRRCFAASGHRSLPIARR